jgi:hypothetical protein
MEVGMLWFDDDSRRGLEEKVARAAAHYKQKYGQMPTLCFVNPGTLNGGPDVAAGVQIKPVRTVLPNHFWIGVGDPVARIAAVQPARNGANGAKKRPARRSGKRNEGKREKRGMVLEA